MYLKSINCSFEVHSKNIPKQNMFHRFIYKCTTRILTDDKVLIFYSMFKWTPEVELHVHRYSLAF